MNYNFKLEQDIKTLWNGNSVNIYKFTILSNNKEYLSFSMSQINLMDFCRTLICMCGDNNSPDYDSLCRTNTIDINRYSLEPEYYAIILNREVNIIDMIINQNLNNNISNHYFTLTFDQAEAIIDICFNLLGIDRSKYRFYK